MQKQVRSAFVCHECGSESSKWHGRCPDCLAWNTVSELRQRPTTQVRRGSIQPVRLQDVVSQDNSRLSTSITEFDRVLGGGIVPGSITLIGGDPGIGKSTLLLQVASRIANNRQVLYVSGEESAPQLKLRADRLGVSSDGLFLLTETDLDTALAAAEMEPFSLVVIDSIQTMRLAELGSAPGGVVQLRECGLRLMEWAKGHNVPVVLIGHVTKDGDIAGPRVLEHIVDAVLYMEGERFSQYRLLRGVKNRFGSVAEVGVFEMRDTGMVEVDNPSEILLAERPAGSIGTVVVPSVEGTRSLLVEIQALVSAAAYGTPQRRATGLDLNRMLLVTAVLGRHARMPVASHDILVSVAGGMRIQEPALDLGLALAIASCMLDRPLPRNLAAFGEIGLSGELRSVGQVERRLVESARLGFTTCMLPARSAQALRGSLGIDIIPCESIADALRVGVGLEPVHQEPRQTARRRRRAGSRVISGDE